MFWTWRNKPRPDDLGIGDQLEGPDATLTPEASLWIYDVLGVSPHLYAFSRLDVVYVVYWSMREIHCSMDAILGHSTGNQSPYVYPVPANRTCPCQESELIHSIISIMRYVALWLWLLPLQKKRWAQSRQGSAGIWVGHSLESSYCEWPRAKPKLGSSPLLQWIDLSQPPHLHLHISI